MSISEVKILGLSLDELADKGGSFTAREIAQQPDVWELVRELVESHRESASRFLAPLLAQENLRIILTGAGTSAFIGECLAPALLRKLNRRVEAIPTTDLVSGPELYFQRDIPTLLVSFGRSGSSPESVAAIELADRMVGQIHHLVVTCNEDGQLHHHNRQRANALSLLLPDETHDRGFAMTCSFTSMLLSAASLFAVIDSSYSSLSSIRAATNDLIVNGLPTLNELVNLKFKRVVYLGSNELKGLAQEAALKLLELTDGQVVAVYDSPLGFRHGPKTIINAETLVVIFMSNDPYTRRYDLDLLRELRSDRRAGRVLALSATDSLDIVDDLVAFRHLTGASDVDLLLPFIVFAQIFAFLQSLELGVRPDTPSASGTVSRIVRGVTIYPSHAEASDVSGR